MSKSFLLWYLRITILTLVLYIGAIHFSALSQNIVVNKPKADTTITTDTSYIIKSGVKYQIHIGARGGRYIIRTSKSGKEYKQYIR